MGMIPFIGTEALPPSASSGFTRLSRQPDGQGEGYQPLDLPQEALASLPPVPAVPVTTPDEEGGEEASIETNAETASDVAEQLSAFTHMPPPFVRPEESVRLSLVRPPVEPELPPAEQGARAEHSSPALRALTRLVRLESERVPVMMAPDSKAHFPLPAGELALRLAQPGVQGERSPLPTPVGLPPLPGEAVPERELAVADLKAAVGLQPALSAARPTEYQWAPARLTDGPTQWGQQLVEVLKDRVELQVNQNIKQAHIRLDPPELGRLELTVRVEGDRLNVQLNVTNPAVREAMIQSMERLRMSLAPHHAGGVEVNVGQGGEQERGERWQQEKILAGRRQWQEERDASSGAGQDWLNTLV
ncbi:flagellar hook-length control protein FliK [Aeromonas sp. XH]|uniref:flagellar hook-length control protein FliK n=1 Tax=Aeromonas sp. XH TaxID=3081770 RepID=UPI002966F508|nr:flagellar hook-length control protein FliK [Aeromonas sp. XH]WOX48824.1 flagellar hook-length control protein FliK [Aeromonas sp. XH]